MFNFVQQKQQNKKRSFHIASYFPKNMNDHGNK